MYISDILAVKQLNSKVKEVLVNSLLNITFLPEVVNSLVAFGGKSKKEKFSLNTCIFILIQTFKIFKEVSQSDMHSRNFLRVISLSLFSAS